MSRDEGSAVVEFMTLAMVLLLPLVYLVATLGRLQAASFAVDSAAREAARAFSAAPQESIGRRRAAAAVRLAMLDQGFDGSAATLTLTCSARPCLSPGARVTARISVAVVLPGIPGFVDALLATHVTVGSTQTATVDAFRAAAQRP